MGALVRNIMPERRAELLTAICEGLRVVCPARNGNVSDAVVEQVFGPQLGIDVNQHTVGGLSLAGMTCDRVAMIEVRMRRRIKLDYAASDKPSSLEKRLASGPLQGSELQGCTLVVRRYAGIAGFHGLVMALKLDPCKPLKTRRGCRGSKLTPCGPTFAKMSGTAAYRS